MPATSANPPADSEHRAIGSLPSAVLLALTGGALDAFIYLNHGHVFAAAMTGNGVLLGVSILHHDYAQTVRHLLPIFGFITGAFLANLLDKSLKHHAVTVGLVCEIARSSSPHSFPAVSPISPSLPSSPSSPPTRSPASAKPTTTPTTPRS